MVAAERREFSGILAHAQRTSRAALKVHWARSAWLSGHEMLLVANGAGAPAGEQRSAERDDGASSDRQRMGNA